MNWYEDTKRRTYVATYSIEKLMRAEVEAAARFGFVTQTMAHTGKVWTVTYHRDERAWARIQVENALQQLSQEQEKLHQAKSKINGLQSDLQARFRAARNETSNPTQLEKRLLQAITDLIAARNAANLQRQAVLTSYATLKTARAEAAKLQIEVPQADRDVEAESAPIRSEMNAEEHYLERELALQRVQENVLKAVQEWQKVVGDHWGAAGKVSGAEKKAASHQAAATTVDLKAASAAEAKARAAEAELARHKTKLGAMEALLQQQEAELLRQLAARDRVYMAAVPG